MTMEKRCRDLYQLIFYKLLFKAADIGRALRLNVKFAIIEDGMQIKEAQRGNFNLEKSFLEKLQSVKEKC